MNIPIFVLVLMILGHLVADYTLQGWLAQGKQESYWKLEKSMYKNDWVPALICHSVYWAIIITLPIILMTNSYDLGLFWLTIPVNAIIHFVVDDQKCNRFKINLIEDQFIHTLQIIFTWMLWLITL